MKIDQKIAKKVLKIVDAGLVEGMGIPKPGKMCVEAAVCFAMGLPHSDNPSCVGSSVREYKITLNDANWSSNLARAKGMRKLAVAQLGSDRLDQVEFSKRVAEQTIRVLIPALFRKVASSLPEKHQLAFLKTADRCEQEGTVAAAYAADAAARAAADAARAAAAAAAAYAAYAARAAADAADAAAYAARAAAADAADAARAAAAAAAYAAAAAADAYAARAAAAAAAYAAAAAAAYAARAAAADAADAARAAADEFLNLSADIALNALIEMKSPGCKYLYLTEEK